MKTKVAVEVNLMRVVYVEVEHDEGDDPLDLTEDERAEAMDDACLDNAIDMGAEIVGIRLADKHEQSE